MNHLSKLSALVIGGAAVAGSVLIPSEAQAIVSQFGDRTNWENSTVDVETTEDFNGVTPQSLNSGANTIGLLETNITGQANDHSISSGAGGDNIDGTNYYQAEVDDGGGNANSFTITFPEEIISWGADFAGLTDNDINVSFGNAPDTVVNFDIFDVNGASGFIGWTVDTPFTTVSFTGNGVNNGGFGIDNISFVPVPFEFESALGLGALAILWGGNHILRKRRRQVKVS
jgi:hypothetical protein